MMIKEFKMLRMIKPFKEGAALIAVDERGNALVQDPIDQGAERETQSIRPGDQNDAPPKNEETEGPIKLLG